MVDLFIGVYSLIIGALNGEVRLRNKNISQINIGVVEIYYNGTWGTICSKYLFSRAAANILCKELGFQAAVSYDCCSKYANLTGKIWIGSVLN